MDAVREYLIGVIAVAVLCSIVTSFLSSKGMIGTAVKLIASLVMLLAVIRPWVNISVDKILDWTDSIAANGANVVADGQMMAEDSYRQGIIERTRSYIEDEAKALDCNLTVEVILCEDTPIPKQVRLTGEVSPYARQALSNILSERLGIKQEDQIWT